MSENVLQIICYCCSHGAHVVAYYLEDSQRVGGHFGDVSKAPFPLVKNPLTPTNIWLLSAMGMDMVGIHSLVKWFCRRGSTVIETIQRGDGANFPVAFFICKNEKIWRTSRQLGLRVIWSSCLEIAFGDCNTTTVCDRSADPLSSSPEKLSIEFFDGPMLQVVKGSRRKTQNLFRSLRSFERY